MDGWMGEIPTRSWDGWDLGGGSKRLALGEYIGW